METDLKALERPRGAPRRWALAATAGIALTSVLTAVAPASADTYIDPNDRCLPGSDAPAAPASDRATIDEAHLQSVDCVFAQKIAIGTADGRYDPGGYTTRGQMASFLVRALEAGGYTVPQAGGQGFTDISGNTHENNINRLAAIGVTLGKTKTTYAPQELVRRDQMASFVVRSVGFAFGGDDFPVGEEKVPAFVDVPPTNTHYDNVNSAAQVLGLAAGRTENIFAPAALTERQAMASFLVRVVDMTLQVK